MTKNYGIWIEVSTTNMKMTILIELKRRYHFYYTLLSVTCQLEILCYNYHFYSLNREAKLRVQGRNASDPECITSRAILRSLLVGVDQKGFFLQKS